MSREDRVVRAFVVIASGIAVLLLIVPPLALIVRALTSFSWERLPDSGIIQAISLSLLTTSVSAVGIVALGIPLAYVLARWDFPLKGMVNLLVQMPIVLPPAVAGLALLITFGRRGVIGASLYDLGLTIPFTTTAVIIAQIFVSAPFFVRAAQLGFQNVSREVEDAARVDGASGVRLFWHITLPLSWRSMAVGLTLSWARALGEFGATILFAGSQSGRTQTLPLLVYSGLARDIDSAIWTGLILIVMALAVLGILQRLSYHLQRSGADHVRVSEDYP